MSRYYCPFCSSNYEYYITRSDGVLICGHCGDPLIKKSSLYSRRIIGIIAAFSFLAPLIIMFLFVLRNFNKDNPPMNSETVVIFTLDKLWKI